MLKATGAEAAKRRKMAQGKRWMQDVDGDQMKQGTTYLVLFPAATQSL